MVCGVNSWIEEILDMNRTLRSLDIDYSLFNTDKYYDRLSRLNKRLYKFKLLNNEEEYITHKQNEFTRTVDEIKPDIILLINPPDTILSPYFLKTFAGQINVYMWLVDGIRKMQNANDYLPLCDKIFCFEPDDVQYIQDLTGKRNVFYCPVGYGTVYANKVAITKKVYDICFVGTPTMTRLPFLVAVAQYASDNNLALWLSGKFYDSHHFWKKYIFKRKYPILYKYIYNGDMSPEEVARVYRKSKICLNIHNANHSGLNPRTFDIMATGSFQLLDNRSDYRELIHPGIDCDVYQDVETLISKLRYYLANEKQREKMATSGQRNVTHGLCITDMLKRILFAKTVK